jgi:hypothetical protein
MLGFPVLFFVVNLSHVCSYRTFRQKSVLQGLAYSFHVSDRNLGHRCQLVRTNEKV